MYKFFFLFVLLAIGSCNGANQGSSYSSVNRKTLNLPNKGIYLSNVKASEVEGFAEADFDLAKLAFERSCIKFVAMPPSQQIGWPAGKAQDWQDACFKIGEYDDYKAFFEENFDFYEIFKDKNYTQNTAFFTGYYVPEMEGSLVRTARFKYPLYKYPADRNLLGLSREEIKNGAFDGKGLELLYVEDPIELFFLHIQGSGKIKLQNGEVVRVGYSGSNGQRYTAIGRYLVEIGEMEEKDVSLENIKKWLKKNPSKAQDVMNKNKRYIYFKIAKTQELEKAGPKGAFDVGLTPLHSLAVDKRFIPLGVPMYISTQIPTEDGGVEDIAEIMLAQDVGSGIEGLLRGDIFFGVGDDAKRIAGNMKHDGKMYIMLPKKKIKFVPVTFEKK